MANAYVGGVGFSSGFSNGFSNLPLGISFLDIKLPQAEGRPGTNILPTPLTISIDGLTTNVSIGMSTYISNPAKVDIIFKTIDSVGISTPDWKNQCDDIDNNFWDKDTPCKANESSLYDTLNTGMINQYGVPAVWYMVDYSTNNEKVFGEDNDRLVQRKFNIVYMIDQLLQDDKLWSKWGVEGMDNFRIYISKPHFREASKYDPNGVLAYYQYEPKPGDILMSTHNNVFYEAIEVKNRYELFLQRSHTWEVTLRPLVNKHYTLSPILSGDQLQQVTSAFDILAQNNEIDNIKNDVLCNPSNDPFSLF
jgi:hypothetical protein